MPGVEFVNLPRKAEVWCALKARAPGGDLRYVRLARTGTAMHRCFFLTRPLRLCSGFNRTVLTLSGVLQRCFSSNKTIPRRLDAEGWGAEEQLVATFLDFFCDSSGLSRHRLNPHTLKMTESTTRLNDTIDTL